MSILTDLKAALEAKQEADKEWEPFSEAIVCGYEARLAAVKRGKAYNRYTDALTDDTIAAMLTALEAAQGASSEWRNYTPGYEPFCAAMDEQSTVLAPLMKEDVCPVCDGHGGGGGFDRDSSHSANEYREYPCQTCGKEADDE